jgi:hypothetical protein
MLNRGKRIELCSRKHPKSLEYGDLTVKTGISLIMTTIEVNIKLELRGIMAQS